MKKNIRTKVIEKKTLYSSLVWGIAFLYLAIPILIFFMGWLKWYFAVPACFILVVSFYKFIQGSPELWFPELSRRTIEIIIMVFVLICVWVYMSGIGGMVYQNPDHQYRNGIFRLLVEENWPVINQENNRGLIYYIAYWLPAAVVGKIFGIDFGTRFQAIWAIAGICILYYFICAWRKKLTLWPLIFFIFFSGLDYLGALTMGTPGIQFGSTESIEFWASGLYQYSSNTTMLFWVFNQALPCWIIIVLLINQKDIKNLVLLLAMSMLSSTLPFVGLIPFVLYYLIRLSHYKDIRKFIKSLFSFNNVIAGGIVGVCSFLYLMGNSASNRIGSASTSAANLGVVERADVSRTAVILLIIVFCFFEFGIYCALIYKYQKNNPLLYIVCISLIIAPFIKVGSGTDFCMRASIPALFFLMLLIIQTIEEIKYKDKVLLFAIILALAIGAITPIHEMGRTIRNTAERCDTLMPILDEEIPGDIIMNSPNFSGDLNNNLFYKVFAK